MTVIAVKKSKKFIEMSCDSQISGGDYKFDKEKGENKGKIFKENGMLIGSAGSRYESNLMKLFSKNHQPKNANPDDVLEFLLEFRDWTVKKTGDSSFKTQNQYLIVFKGKVFEVWRGDVEEKCSFWAIGSGMFLALSALDLGKSTVAAINVAKKYDLYCGGETETLKINI